MKETLSKLREQRGATRREVAIATGLTEATICELEWGSSTNPTTSTLTALADYYGVTVDVILGREDPK
jgi:transcriptional regulator with XRE-family HTH domain